MDELEPNPQGESPEPEPAPPVAEPVTGGPPEDAAPAEDVAAEPSLSVDELMATRDVPFDDTTAPVSQEDSQIKAILEAIVYVADEPLTLAQIAASLQQPVERVKDLLDQ